MVAPVKQKDDNSINAAISHIVLCCVAGEGMYDVTGFNFTNPGMHANFLLFGVIGYLHSQSGRLNIDVSEAYNISSKATRYLPLACVMADLHKENHWMAGLHLLSGIVPFALSLNGKRWDNAQIGNLVLACNILALGHHSLENNFEWGCYTAAAAIFAYYLTPQMGLKIMYPFGLALMEYCTYRSFQIKLERKRLIVNFIIAVLLIVDPCGC